MSEPTLEVLAVEIRHEREMREELAKRLDERNASNEAKAAAALAAQKAASAAAFDAAERAIEKAETAQHAHNLAANEWRATLENHAKRQISRTEADTQFDSIKEKIEELSERQAQDVQNRTEEALSMARASATRLSGALLTLALALVGWGITVAIFLLRGGN